MYFYMNHRELMREEDALDIERLCTNTVKYFNIINLCQRPVCS